MLRRNEHPLRPLLSSAPGRINVPDDVIVRSTTQRSITVDRSPARWATLKDASDGKAIPEI